MRFYVLVGLVGFLAATSPAAVLFDQGPTTGTYGGSWVNQTAGQNFADQFVLANDSTVSRYVYYTNFDPASFGTFTVKLLADSASAPGVDPGTLIGTQTITQSGYSLVGSFGGIDVYRVNLDLVTPWVLTGGVRYWAGASGDGFEAAQVSLNPGPGDSKMAQFSGPSFAFNATVGDQQFGLEGEAVPEPATLAALALGGLAFVRSRRKRA